MTDRELLELAAKAAGYDTSHSWNAERMVMPNPEVGLCIPGVSTCWNPLADEGDALRLAVDLSLSLCTDGVASVSASTCYQHGNRLVTQDVSDSDKRAATRRVIVRAAAEIGRNMK